MRAEMPAAPSASSTRRAESGSGPGIDYSAAMPGGEGSSPVSLARPRRCRGVPTKRSTAARGVVGLVEPGQMAGALDDSGSRRPRDALLEERRVARGEQLVLGAPQHERARADAMEPLAQAVIAHRPHQPRGGFVDAERLHLPLEHLGVAQPRRRGGEFAERVGVRSRAARPAAAACWRRTSPAVPSRRRDRSSDQHQLAHRGVGESRRLGGEDAAGRGADQVAAGDAGRLQQIERHRHPVGEVVEVVMTRLAPREARRRERHHAALLGEPIEERRPARQAAQAGKESERRSVALLPDPATAAADLDERLLGRLRSLRAPRRRRCLRS